MDLATACSSWDFLDLALKHPTSNRLWYNFSMPPANLTSPILSLVYFFPIWRVLIFVSPCMEIIPSFHCCSDPFLSIFQFFQMHFGNGRSQMSNEGSQMQPRYRFICNEVLCFVLYCSWFAFFLTATENQADAMVDTHHTHKISFLTGNSLLRTHLFLCEIRIIPPKPLSHLRWRQGWLLSLGYRRMLLSVLVSISKNVSPENLTWTYPLLLYSLYGLRRPASIY